MKTYKKTRWSLIFTAAVSIITLGGCATSLDSKVQGEKSKAPVALQTQELPTPSRTVGGPESVYRKAQEFQSGRVVRKAVFPYIGGRMVSSTEEDALPAVFSENYILDFGLGQVPLSVVAARLTKLTGIPVRIRPDVYRGASGGATGAPRPVAATSMALPVPLPSNPGLSGAILPPAGLGRPNIGSTISSDTAITIEGVNMRWNGRLRDFLDNLTNVLSLAWEYRDGTVVIMRMVTETYEVAAFSGSQSYSMSNAGSGSGTSGSGGSSQSSSSAVSVSSKGEGDARKSILATLNALVLGTPGSIVTASDGTGRIVVTTSKETQAQVREYLKNENKLLRQMVNVTFDLYSYRTSITDTKGIDWSAVYKNLAGGYSIGLRAPASLAGVTAGGITSTVLSGRFQDTTAVLSLLNQSGQSFQHRPISINTMNGQWNSKSDTTTEGYIKETTPGNAGASGASGAPGLKTDTVTTGDQYAVLPQVMQDNSVMVKYSIGLSDLLGLFDQTSGQGATLQKVQTPKTKSTSESATILLAPGQVSMITGLTRVTTADSENKLAESAPVALGGSRNISLLREYFIVVVRATPI